MTSQLYKTYRDFTKSMRLGERPATSCKYGVKHVAATAKHHKNEAYAYCSRGSSNPKRFIFLYSVVRLISKASAVAARFQLFARRQAKII